MKAKDLMIGDWYAFRGHPYKCTAYDIASLAECEEKGAPTDISEIPLTPEILEKNGFVHEDTHDVWILEYGEIIIEVGIYHPDFINVNYKHITPDGINEGNISSICKVDGSDIMTHKLQHALKLCGIDKEIKL